MEVPAGVYGRAIYYQRGVLEIIKTYRTKAYFRLRGNLFPADEGSMRLFFQRHW